MKTTVGPFKTFIIAISLLTLIISSAYASQIIGGKSIGPVTLGEPIQKFEKFLGPGQTMSPTFFNYPSKKMAVLVKNGTVQGIMVYGPEYATKEGIKVGMPLSSVTKAYGNYLRTDAGSLVYSELGLSFNEKDGKVARIMVVQAAVDILLGDKAIVGGVRAGNIKIGMDISQVVKHWGEPTKKNTMEGNKSVEVYQYDTKAVKVLSSSGVVAGIQINSYKFRTPEGIGINSTREQVVKTYGTKFKAVKESIMYPSMGLGFYFSKNKVIEILLTYRRE